MKYFTSKKLIIEVSERELELIERAAGYAADVWFKRAQDSLNEDRETYNLRMSIYDDYCNLQKSVAELNNQLPF